MGTYIADAGADIGYSSLVTQFLVYLKALDIIPVCLFILAKIFIQITKITE